jgi:hypothetical protein
LEGIANGTEPGVERANRACVKSGVGYFATRIREQDFFRQAEHEEGDASREFVRGQDAIFELVGQERELEDRSRDQVREHGDEAGEIDEVRHRFGFAAVNVDRVAQRLEGVEADPEREDDSKKGVELCLLQPERLDQPVVAFDPEVEVFEKTECGEIQDDGDQDCVALGARARAAERELFHRLMQDAPKPPGVMRDDLADQPIHERRREHERHEARLGPAVEGVARENEPEIAPAVRRAAQRIIAGQRERQEIVDENVRAKNHAGVGELSPHCE